MESGATGTTNWPLIGRLRALPGLSAVVRVEPPLLAIALLSAVGYSLYSVWEHNHFLTDFDLAIADQAVWNYSNLSSPEITTINPPVNMLGDHFSRSDPPRPSTGSGPIPGCC